MPEHPPETLIDLRCLQDGEDKTARAILLAARTPCSNQTVLTGLVDAGRPALPEWARAPLDGVRCFAGAPSRLVQLSPLHDPLLVARLLLRGVPSVTLPVPARRALRPAQRISWALARHWQARYGHVLPATDPDAFWSAVAALPNPAPRPAGRARMALLDPAPPQELVEALQARLALHVHRGPRSALPLLSPRFDRVVSTGGAARYGGAWLLGRDPADPQAEAAAEYLLTYSPATKHAVDRRALRPVTLLPRPVAPSPMDRDAARRLIGAASGDTVLAAVVTGWGAEHCIWALDLLRFWGASARLHLIGPAPCDWPRLYALARSLELADRIALMPARLAAPHWGTADLGLMLAPSSEPAPVDALHAAAAHGLRCVATRSVAAAIPAPCWVSTVPDAPSPVLLAEAVLGALAGTRPRPADSAAYAARHTPERAAAALCAALGL